MAVTPHLNKINIPKKGLVLWDTRGIESKHYEETTNQLRKEIKSSFSDGLNDIPHLAWMCIDAAAARIEARDIELIGILQEHDIPIVVVFTKAIPNDSNEFVREATNEINKYYNNYVSGNYVRVNSKDRMCGFFAIPVSGLDELLDISFKCISKDNTGAKQALKKSQIVKKNVRLEAMKSAARNVVHGASAATGMVGASPIPGSDAPLIAAIQGVMIYKINAEFELDESTSKTTSVVTGILGITAVAQAGKTVFSNLIKFIPGAGTIIGGAVSAVTAITITQAIGHAYIQLLVSYYNNETGNVDLPENTIAILSAFKDFYPLAKPM